MIGILCNHEKKVKCIYGKFIRVARLTHLTAVVGCSLDL